MEKGEAGKEHLLDGYHTRNQLPHRKRQGGTYFVSFRLAGTLPHTLIAELKRERELIVENAERAQRPLSWTERRRLFEWYSERVDSWLDACHGECWLRRKEIADLVAGAVQFFEGCRYDLLAWVVMPNHVHVVVQPLGEHSLSAILHSWKSFTANRANDLLKRSGKPFWQVEAYDHLIRDEEDLNRCRAYTEFNPVKAGLCEYPEQWQWSSAYMRALGGSAQR